MSSWLATHRTPIALEARPAPDPSLSASVTLGPGTHLRVVERRGDWARVDAENGWWGWVDARPLEAIRETLDPALRQALMAAADACIRALDEHAAGRLDEDGLRRALVEAATVRWNADLWLLELETGRWWRFDGTRMAALDVSAARAHGGSGG